MLDLDARLCNVAPKDRRQTDIYPLGIMTADAPLRPWSLQCVDALAREGPNSPFLCPEPWVGSERWPPHQVSRSRVSSLGGLLINCLGT